MHDEQQCLTITVGDGRPKLFVN